VTATRRTDGGAGPGTVGAVRTVDWVNEQIVIIDQTALPQNFTHLTLTTRDEVIDAIRRLAVRGAPAIGATGALGVALLALDAKRNGRSIESILPDAEAIADARPTAVNLRWAVTSVLTSVPKGHDAVINAAVDLMHADVATNIAMTNRAADLLEELCAHTSHIRVHTHCNTGDLATVEGGTGVGAAFRLHERGRLGEVIADETRPLLQGSRLTAFELAERGIPYRISVDGAGPTCVARGLVDVAVIGADRIAANGDTANKVGSYPLALACKRAGIPFVVVAPESTLDPATPGGAEIHIEMRADHEVTHIGNIAVAPAGATAVNFAFDITPADLITAIVTEHRVIRPTPTTRIEPWPTEKP
jgi:methylthioribose-1-phosphate isomerase